MDVIYFGGAASLTLDCVHIAYTSKFIAYTSKLIIVNVVL
jgi:hypothetical protein